jgi:broad specificity phosphatase PhoE
MGELEGTLSKNRGETLPLSVERNEDLIARALKWWNTDIVPLTQSQSSAPIHVLVVGHGAFIRTLLGSLANQLHYSHTLGDIDPSKKRVSNTRITEIRIVDGRGFFHRHDDISHLTGPAIKGNADDLAEEVEFRASDI